ncbi:hypothetical protein ACOI1C_22395 [Bacillus sp. DJP31]|uniref:hypothetical protein n=1 Tax=Bacillus sp. DJP31 TaxID=3409789 RepID=UPI003BB5B5DE
MNYFLTVWKAIKENEEFGLKSSCFFNVFSNELQAIDGYIRRRLRVAMIHSHPTQRKGWLLTRKWSIEFFVKIGLVPFFQYYYGKQFGHTPESYVEYMKEKQQKKHKRKVQKAKERGEEYYTPERVRYINYAQRAKHSM